MVTTDEHSAGLVPRPGDMPPLKIRTKPDGSLEIYSPVRYAGRISPGRVPSSELRALAERWIAEANETQSMDQDSALGGAIRECADELLALLGAP